MSELIVGIDLGTTNSEVAAFLDGQVRVLGPGDQRILPSCVGFSESGELLVGRTCAQSTGPLSREDRTQHQAQDGQRGKRDAGRKEFHAA